jgi:hypothetical protein
MASPATDNTEMHGFIVEYVHWIFLEDLSRVIARLFVPRLRHADSCA